MTLEQRIYQADRAKEVLENEAFQQVFEDAKQEITDQWMKSPARDVDGREKLWMMLSLLGKLEAMLHTSLDDGKLATAELERQRSIGERIRGLFG